MCVDCGVPITRYARLRCKGCGNTKLRRPVPNDFASMLALIGSTACARHYRASADTVTRWRQELGIRKGERAPVLWSKGGLSECL